MSTTVPIKDFSENVHKERNLVGAILHNLDPNTFNVRSNLRFDETFADDLYGDLVSGHKKEKQEAITLLKKILNSSENNIKWIIIVLSFAARFPQRKKNILEVLTAAGETELIERLRTKGIRL